ncbi:MAG TPA: hypothetical protein VKU77_18920 [Streptosporangiaceae bacterium]|nr:hypothetical protein [Streptosporangiaceae bacterium]
MSEAVSAVIDELGPAMWRGDFAGFHRLLVRLGGEGPQLAPDQLTAAIGQLAPLLANQPGGVFARLALVAGAFTEWGGSPLALAPYVPASALRALQLRARFSELWPVAGGGRAEPDPDRAPSMDELVGTFEAAAGRLGLSETEPTVIALSWFDVGHWVNLLMTVLAHRDFRAAAGLRAEIAEAAARLGDLVPGAHWLPGLARVLDDEPVIVVDHTGRYGFRLAMSGVGDNCQLHTLLADRLIGDPARGFVPGEPPSPSWVAAATAAPPQLPPDDLVVRRFRLFDGSGAYIYPEGVPADISLTAGTRVIVLHPPRGPFAWTSGRTYAHMTPELILDQVLSPADTQMWHARIAPARETDLFGAAAPAR